MKTSVLARLKHQARARYQGCWHLPGVWGLMRACLQELAHEERMYKAG